MCETQRSIIFSAGLDSAILPARVANPRAEFASHIINQKYCFYFQLAPERGRYPAASEKHSPWGEALKHHAVTEVRDR